MHGWRLLVDTPLSTEEADRALDALADPHLNVCLIPLRENPTRARAWACAHARALTFEEARRLHAAHRVPRAGEP
jgi:hypothetical protein